ncbi:type II toxin-antitoxin system RelE/ParE family toxin [Pararhizobium sp. O133]|uniref:type II toxin-antitoxin system RelE/ParE family toxin n=1 Tax=Pararhizobium sp. O133 TaxID=3449278 RepID=UPI003F684933
MTHKIVFRPTAEADLIALYEYIAKNSGHARAGAYISRIEAACMTLADFPLRRQSRDDLYPGIRLIGFERRVSIAFSVEGEFVRILRIFYGGRDFPDTWPED